MKPLHAWKGLSRAERAMARTAIWSSLVVGTRLRLFGYPSCRKSVESIPPKHHYPNVDEISRVTLGITRRLPWSPNCLERSLLLIRMLRLHGHEPLLRLGVRRRGQSLEFHAWVEANGKVVADREDIAGTFAPFGETSLPPEARFV